MTHKELKTKALTDPETRVEYETQKPEFELLDKLLEGKNSAGSRLKPAPRMKALRGRLCMLEAGGMRR